MRAACGRSRFEINLSPRLGCWNSTLITPHTGHPMHEFRKGVHTRIIFHLKIGLTKSFSAGLGRAIAAGTAPIIGLQSHFGGKPVQFQALCPQANAQMRGNATTTTCPANIKEHKNGPHLTITRLLPNDSCSVTPILGCWKSTLISPHTEHLMRCGFYHDDRLRQGFDLMRAAWA